MAKLSREEIERIVSVGVQYAWLGSTVEADEDGDELENEAWVVLRRPQIMEVAKDHLDHLREVYVRLWAEGEKSSA